MSRSRGWHSTQQITKTNLINCIESEMRIQKINQSDIAEALNTKQPNVANHVKKGWNFTIDQTIAILDCLGYDLIAIRRETK